MAKKRKHILLSMIVLMIIGGLFGGIKYMAYKKGQEHQKMVEIATSKEARKVYEDKIKREDEKAFTEEGIIKSYKIDESSLGYNPMGGLMVTIIINENQELNINFNLISNGDSSYHSAYYGISSKLGDLLGY